MNSKCEQCGSILDLLTAFSLYRVCGSVYAGESSESEGGQVNRGKILAALIESGRVSIIPIGSGEGEREHKQEGESERGREGASE
jgi:hypothetical protein